MLLYISIAPNATISLIMYANVEKSFEVTVVKSPSTPVPSLTIPNSASAGRATSNVSNSARISNA